MRRIAVLRSNAIGDYLMATPALAALRSAFPDAELTLLAAGWHRAFLDGRPGPVDRVLVLPEVPGLAGQPGGAPPDAELPGFLAAARAYGYDLAVQLHGGGARSNPLVTDLGAHYTIGLRAPDAPGLDATVPYRYYQPEVARYLEVVGLVGATGPAEYPELASVPGEDDRAERLLPAQDGPWVALNPGAGDPRRRWSTARFAAVADAVMASGARVVVVGSDADVRTAAEITARARSAPLDLTGRTDLGTLAAVLRRCAVVVSNDSGPLHVARAVGARTVGLYWCGNAINAAPETRSRHRPLLSWRVHCVECGVDCTPVGSPHRPGNGCSHRSSFVDEIPVAEVVDEVEDLLRASPAAGTDPR
ncbi:glycosyltransferase family 9 protein [Pseudonocardia sp.]|jgi:ADP-heptose:LPS heptosyltransferase|uniref:glycosyltransferase family 9 protein n=1 Tax=Pseudonocardia sp. TaxID=60912 RepID=UPI0026163890|nr:glycosyltransferase family 9 protein [Pseudonocardia sp.]MCW2721105.1 glycosyl transferase [Pseudonocardia sp.]MDT7618257.1 hypothetical protein [Pseudonocardiales bacterium]